MRPRIIARNQGGRQPHPVVDSRVSYSGKRGQSVLALLQKLTKLETIPFKGSVFVASIDGIRGDSERAWVFSVNGKIVSQAADAVVTTDHDTVEWQLVQSD